jgi:hypothetical protein
MAEEVGRIPCEIWQDPEFLALGGGTQWVFILLLTLPGSSPTRPIPLMARRWSRYAAGLSHHDVVDWLAELEAADFIDCDWDMEELRVLRYALPHWILDSGVKRKKSKPRPPIHAGIRAAVMERDGCRCVECGCRNDLTLDHIVPWSRGGPDTVDNLRVLCRPCNSSKGARI